MDDTIAYPEATPRVLRLATLSERRERHLCQAALARARDDAAVAYTEDMNALICEMRAWLVVMEGDDDA